jgi:hypothetical protein
MRANVSFYLCFSFLFCKGLFMKVNGVSPTDKLNREAQRARYAPRNPIKKAVVSNNAEHRALTKLTAEVLDQLKLPSAIPSRVILAALIKARSF